MVEGQTGLTWERWKALVDRVERWGFYGLYRSDHFTLTTPPDYNSLEMIVSLTYVADHTRSVRFGPLVAPVSFRDPSCWHAKPRISTRLSEGRMALGVGAGGFRVNTICLAMPMDKRAAWNATRKDCMLSGLCSRATHPSRLKDAGI